MTNTFYSDKLKAFVEQINSSNSVEEYSNIRTERDKFIDDDEYFHNWQQKNGLIKNNIESCTPGMPNMKSQTFMSDSDRECSIQKNIFDNAVELNEDRTVVDSSIQYFNISNYNGDVILVDNQGFEVNFSDELEHTYTNMHDKLCFEIYKKCSLKYRESIILKFHNRLCKNTDIKKRLFVPKFICGHEYAVIEKTGKPKYFLGYCGSSYCDDGFDEFVEWNQANRKLLAEHKKQIPISDISGCVAWRFKTSKIYYEQFMNAYGRFISRKDGKRFFMPDRAYGRKASWLHDSLGIGHFSTLTSNILKEASVKVQNFLNDYKMLIKYDAEQKLEDKLNRKLSRLERKKVRSSLKCFGVMDISFNPATKEYYLHYHVAVKPYNLRFDEFHFKNIKLLAKINNIHFESFGLKKLGGLVDYFAKRKAGIYHFSDEHSNLFLLNSVMNEWDYLNSFYSFHKCIKLGWSVKEMEIIKKNLKKQLLYDGYIQQVSLIDGSIAFTRCLPCNKNNIRISECSQCHEKRVRLFLVSDEEFKKSDYGG